MKTYQIDYVDKNGSQHIMRFQGSLKSLLKKVQNLQKEGCVIKKGKELKDYANR